MSEKSAIVMEITQDLIINNVEEIKTVLLEQIDLCNELEICLEKVEIIDISGLQLLISTAKELKDLKKNLLFTGVFTEGLRDSLNKISFCHNLITNGEDFNIFITDTV